MAVILRDGTANDDTSLHIYARKHIVEYFTTNVVEVDIYAIGAGSFDGVFNFLVLFFIINTVVKSQLLDYVATLFRPPRYAHSTTTFESGNLDPQHSLPLRQHQKPARFPLP